MVLHLAAFAESAARDGLQPIAPCPPDALEPIATYNGDDLRLARPTNLIGMCCVTETPATLLSWRMKKATWQNWLNFNLAMRGDDAGVEPDDMDPIGSLVIPCKQNDVLNMEADNTNTAALDSVGLFFGSPGDISPVPLPYNKVIEGQATGTLTVDEWTDIGAIIWSEAFQAAKIYNIVGIHFHSATGHFGRLNLSAMGILNKPGYIASATRLCGDVLWGNFGSFVGTNPPGAEFLANTADTAETITLFCQVDFEG